MSVVATPASAVGRRLSLLAENGWITLRAVIGAALLGYFVTVQLPSSVQFVIGVFVVLLISSVARRFPQYRLAILIVSGVVSSRYLYWRITSTLNFDSPANALVSLTLVGAELYAVAILLLGFFQTVETLERSPVPLPADPGHWPTVDVFVPTYNEPVEVVLPTLIGCKSMDYPKKRVYLLDDGRREEMRRLCERIGVGYVVRGDNKHAKAGNINAALIKTDGEFVAIFDCDHIPTRAFLQLTVGFFRDPKMALVQTPHHFFNPDSFERNLHVYGEVPSEQDLFYHQIQPASDFWNATFFCGSCAVIRRSALLEVGGIATETVTEDCHTSMRMHSLGYESCYLNIPLAAGLAAERFAAHITQRIRWSRGMVQILRLDSPFTKPGLSWAQKLCYFNSMVHFLFGVPRLVYMIAPAFYLLLDLNTIVASAFDVVAYAFPHIFVSIVANSISSKSLRHTFWAEVYETSIGYYTAMATTLALLRPRHGKFAVTAKGFKGTDAFYDWRSARPVLFLIALNLLSVLAVPLNVWFKVGEGSSIFINSMWSLYNLIILGACAFVAYEQPETRSIWRHDRRLPVRLAPDGDDDASVWGETIDVALGGMRVALPAGVSPPASGELEMHYEFGHPFEASFDTRWTRDTESGCEIGLRLAKLDFDKQCELIRIIFGSASNWINGQYEEDRPLRSFTRVLVTPYRAWSAVRKKRATLRSAGANGGDLGDEGPEVTDGSGDDATDGSPAPH